jgi:amino acid transporter
MGNRIKRLLIGRPLKNEAIAHEKYGVLWGLPVLASDPISSVAYAGEQILLVLLPIFYAAAYAQLQVIISVIMGLLIVLIISYRQTIENYPNGGGAYIVAKDNLGSIVGVVAGSALAVDYILTVAVSVASGVEQITTAFEFLRTNPHIVEINILIGVGIVLLLMVGNLRGIRESSRIFGMPTYLFIVGMAVMIFTGAYKLLTRPGFVNPLPVQPEDAVEAMKNLTGSAFMILMLRAFSNGCAALTGVEAVSNAVPNFKEPGSKNAKKVLLILAFCVFFIMTGTTILAANYHVVVGGEHQEAVLVQLARLTFGSGTFMYFYVAASTFVLLVLAANTAYSDFPLLLSLMSRDGYAPKQLRMRGDRLSFSNGIIMLSAAAILLIVVFRAKVNALIGLYAIGVFISFTLSQSGMFRRWFRRKEKHWQIKAVVNGLGALVTAAVVIVIAVFKFSEGAWIVVILLPLMVYLLLRVKKHYTAVAKQLRIPDEAFTTLDISKDHYRNRIIVPMDNVNQASIRALRFAKTISDNVTAFSVAIDEEAENKLRARWSKLQTDIPYIIKYSPYRRVVEPLLEFIKSAEYDYRKGDMISVILPQFVVRKPWQRLMHNRTRVYIERQLLKHKHIVVSVMPFQLKDDGAALGDDGYID